MLELKIEITGRVQGVGFRQFVKRQADALKLKGYVRNRSDGSVIVVAQDSRKVLEQFLTNVQRGPAFSKVESVSYRWNAKPTVTYREFVIVVGSGSFIRDQGASFLNLSKKLLNIGTTVPKHVAIIVDGNRRWARERGLNPTEGHRKSASFENGFAIMQEAKKAGVKYMTLWAFSTENWKRDPREISELFSIAHGLIKQYIKKLPQYKIRFRHIGRKDRLPANLLTEIAKLEHITKDFRDFNLQICLDYGGRDEMSRAINKMLAAGVKEVKEEDIKHYLDSSDIPDPDLIIRTSGEQRISGFMPFQATYAELYFTPVYFPDFGVEEFQQALSEFSRRKRRFGA